MNREMVVVILTLSLGGLVTLVGSLAMPVPSCCVGAWRSARDAERERWRALLRPVLPLRFVAALSAGWALLEPATADEIIPWGWRVAAFVAAALVVRASLRAAWSFVLGFARPADAAMTSGIFVPRVHVGARLREALSPPQLAAVHAHEAAHARHYDPARVLFAQLVTDSQWPSRRARARFDAWLDALEMARDEEAREHGIEGVDLADAVLNCFRIQLVSTAMPGVVGPRARLRERLERMLAAVPPRAAREPKRVLELLSLASVGAAVLVGMVVGEPIVQALCGALP